MAIHERVKVFFFFGKKQWAFTRLLRTSTSYVQCFYSFTRMTGLHSFYISLLLFIYNIILLTHLNFKGLSVSINISTFYIFYLKINVLKKKTILYLDTVFCLEISQLLLLQIFRKEIKKRINLLELTMVKELYRDITYLRKIFIMFFLHEVLGDTYTFGK